MSPTESYQLQSERKLPPGSRHMPECSPAQQRDGIWAKTLHVVSRHQRHRADVKVPSPRSGDFKSCRVGIGLRRKTERELLVLVRERSNRDRLPIALAVAPDQRNLHMASGVATKINPAGILLPLNQGKARLPDAMRRSAVQCNARALVAHKGLVFVHHHNFVRTDWPPFAKLHTA